MEIATLFALILRNGAFAMPEIAAVKLGDVPVRFLATRPS
jgi:Na+(H+)/acetate symporter ActP